MAVVAKWKNSEFVVPLCGPLPFHSIQRTDLNFDPSCLCVDIPYITPDPCELFTSTNVQIRVQGSVLVNDWGGVVLDPPNNRIWTCLKPADLDVTTVNFNVVATFLPTTVLYPYKTAVRARGYIPLTPYALPWSVPTEFGAFVDVYVYTWLVSGVWKVVAQVEVRVIEISRVSVWGVTLRMGGYYQLSFVYDCGDITLDELLTAMIEDRSPVASALNLGSSQWVYSSFSCADDFPPTQVLPLVGPGSISSAVQVV